MLSPMLVQYLVGLCCLSRNSDAVDITLGDMVLDSAAGKARDVDVTITVKEAMGVVRAFKAYEVKRENTPLGVEAVEQLCTKLRDMPAVTNRAIVSASGFTDGARTKAAHHNVELFTINSWSRTVEDLFLGGELAEPPIRFARTGTILLHWIQYQARLYVPSGPESFDVPVNEPLFTSKGLRHPRFATFSALRDALCLRSTETLLLLEPAKTELQILLGTGDAGMTGANSRSWPHAHTIDLASEKVFLKFGDKLARIDTITFSGELQWQSESVIPSVFVMQRVSDGEIFAGASVVRGKNDGEMSCLVIAPGSKRIGVHPVRLAKKHLNAIRKLKLLEQ